LNVKRRIPKVSVCVPTFNGAKHLRQCLDSVVAQSWSGFELLLCDDCSTDDTLSIAREYAAQDSRIRVIENERNLGLVGNWNRCLKLLHGEWIKFVFQDDAIAYQYLERALAHAETDTRLIACRRNFIFDAGTTEERRAYYENHISIDELFPSATRITPQQYCAATLEHMGVNLLGEPTAVMFRRASVDKIGEFNANLIMICDSEYWARLGVNGGCTYVPETLASFRVHGGSASALAFANRQYRLSLDRVVLLHEFVFHPAYAPLRAAAAAREPPMDLMARLADEIRSRRWLAIDAASRRDAPDPTLLLEWKELERRLPRIAAVAPLPRPGRAPLLHRAVRRARKWLHAGGN
jgi:glycosyltransferase involved in cell wall biosynthesis